MIMYSQVFDSWIFAAQLCTKMWGVKEKAILSYSGGGREVVDVRFVMGVFTFYFVDLQGTKFIHHKNIILFICTYCTLFATIANLESQYYPTYVK